MTETETRLRALENHVELLQRELREARAETARVDEWATGIQIVLMEALPLLFREQQEAALKLARLWQNARQEFEAAEAQGQPIERLEPRKMLTAQMHLLGVFEAGMRPGRG